MTLDEYQRLAQATDQTATNPVMSLLGLAGETGTLLTRYKKWLRDGDAYEIFEARIAEDLGDILWYLANVARHFRLGLDAIAINNLNKTSDRFGPPSRASLFHSFDLDFSEAERLPRQFQIVFASEKSENGEDVIQVLRDGKQVGNVLTDNAYEEDGYRYHDAFHFAYATMLGWSPVTRRNLGCKRTSDSTIDRVEDGGRAIVFEESISALAFRRAKDHGYYENLDTIDFDILTTIRGLVATQEVSIRTAREWERAILEGFRIWRLLNKHRGGKVSHDLDTQQMLFHEL